jgi:hypothetical protein
MVCPAVVQSMTRAVHPAQDPDLAGRKGNVPGTMIQVTPYTRDYRDNIKEQSGAGTSDKAILCLIHEERNYPASSFGK